MTQPFPALPNSVHRFEKDGKVVFINGDIPAWIVTDAVGDLIISMIDGQRTVDDIISLIEYRPDEGGIEPVSARHFIQKILESGILEKRPTHPIYQKTPLHNVHLSLSEGCNLRCQYCYARQRIENSAKLTLNEYRKIIERISSAFSDVTFTLTGGEPLLNHDWAAIAQAVKNAGCRAFLLTNGTLIDEHNIDSIATLIDLVTLSIDGSEAAIHAQTRGDNLNKVEQAIRLLESHGVEYSISMTVTRKNIDDVARMAKKYGSRLNYAPLFPTGGDTDSLTISGEEYYKALSEAHGVEPLSFCREAIGRARQTPALKCSIGDGSLSISATGDIYPCQLLHDHSLKAGNVRDDDVVNIIHSSKILDTLAAMTVDTIEGCNTCAFRYFCGGACRARAFYETGQLGHSSPFCIYEQRAFLDGLIRFS